MDDTKIKIIRKMPDGAKLFELWIGILCLAMKSSRAGTLEIGVGIPFTEETLAEHLDIPLKTTRMGLQVFNKFHMVEVWSDGTIFISNFEKHQELEKIEKNKEVTRLRVAKFREKQRISLDVTVTEPLRNDTSNDVDKDKDTDIEQDKDVTVRYTENESFILFWNMYDKKVGLKEKIEKKWNKLSDDDKKKIFEYIPKYKESQPDKQYRKNPDTFLNNKSWNDELIPKNGTPKQPGHNTKMSPDLEIIHKKLLEKNGN